MLTRIDKLIVAFAVNYPHILQNPCSYCHPAFARDILLSFSTPNKAYSIYKSLFLGNSGTQREAAENTFFVRSFRILQINFHIIFANQ